MMLLSAVLALLLGVGFYCFGAYVMFRIGEKFRIGRYRDYLVPVWSIMLLCDCARITRWTAAGLALPMTVTFFLGTGTELELYVRSASAAMFIFCWVYLWGSIAKRLGKNFWLWGVASILFSGIPVLFLAFDGSMPRR